jgi:hypothetical protein
MDPPVRWQPSDAKVNEEGLVEARCGRRGVRVSTTMEAPSSMSDRKVH